jgi:transcriptional regulator with XRE-family HTH domain
MKISKILSEEAILAEIGARIGRRRIERDQTQAALAEEAGLAKRTLERIEAGASAQLSNVLRLLRALDLLDHLDTLIPAPTPSPLELAKQQGKQRRRASPTKPAREPAPAWTWGDES